MALATEEQRTDICQTTMDVEVSVKSKIKKFSYIDNEEIKKYNFFYISNRNYIKIKINRFENNI